MSSNLCARRGSRVRKLLVGLLVTVVITAQAPATPRPVGDLAASLRDDLKFWFHSKGLTGSLGRLLRQDSGQAETQAERDARVASIAVLPGDVTIKMGERVFFIALASDNLKRQVAGVKFKWHAETQKTAKPVTISQTGEFIPPAPGDYKVIVEGAGQKAFVSVTVLKDNDRPTKDSKPVAIREVSSRDVLQPSPPKPPKPASPNVEEEPGGGWNETNYPAADDPENDRGDPPGRPLHHDAGSGNFQLTAPVLALRGRGLDLALNMVYNSRVWTLSNSDITYDIDRDWPAPGWTLGLGRVAGLGVGGSMIIDPDGTRHSFSGTTTQFGSGFINFTGHTTDGTFIDYNTSTDSNGIIVFAQVSFPNGTVIHYGAPGRGAVYPQRITDANGNYISVSYRFSPERGPKITHITDTLGRVVNFYYDGPKLTAITAPGLDGSERELIRLHYKTLTLNYGFSSTLTPHVESTSQDVLDAIYYPGTGTGYWFGDSNSYSSYGMLARYSEQRGMVFSSSSLENQGTVTAGTVTKECVYNYPLTPNTSLTDAPTYTTLTETWDGMDTAAAVTQFLLQKNATTRTTTITFPDLTKSVQLSHRANGQYNDGYIYEDSTFDANDALLRKSTVTWQQGDYGSARPSRVEAFDELSQKTASEFDYNGSYNRVDTIRDYDYGGTALLRTTKIDYRSGSYIGRHILNLVKQVEVWNAANTVRMSRTEYTHDGVTLVNAPGVVQHNEAFDPYIEPVCEWQPDPSDPDCFGFCEPFEPRCDGNCDQIFVCVGGYDPSTDPRGNVTSVKRYANAASLTGAITENRTYDTTGNLITSSSSCCEQLSFAYSTATQYAYPDSQTSGSADTQSPARITTSAIYNFYTGLERFGTDANGRQSEVAYFAATLRPQTFTMSTGATATYAYNDAALSVTETVSESGGAMASQNIRWLNGRGQIKLEDALGQGSIWDHVATQYDIMGRVKKQTRPYRTGQTQQWVETFYDALGRTNRETTPDGSETNSYFNETTRPSSASSLPGQTTRVVDAWGRERWARLDADRRLVEIVEPNPAGNGSVSATGNMVTSYSYDALGNLTLIQQGTQQRSFKYDSLRRVTHEKLAEASATLNDSGQYVGSGTWSMVFAYDERSNLISQTDARGVKTSYVYSNDPLNRVQSVSYNTSGFGDTTHPVLQAADVTYEYMTSGDKTRVLKVTTSGVSTDEYGYDTEGRLNSRTLTITGRSAYPMLTEYILDTLSRVSDIRYPAQYGVTSSPRKLVHHDYDVSSRLTGLKVDNADYASQIAYNASSQSTSLKVGASGANQITESYTFDDVTGLLTNQKVQRGATTMMDLGYDYLRASTSSGRTGQLTKILNNLNHNRDRDYEYDKLGRLARATGGQSASWSQDYVYDRYGNRTSVTAAGNIPGASLPAPTNLTAAAASGGGQIVLNWTASSGAHHYQIERMQTLGQGYQVINTTTSTTYTDTVTSGAAYMYRVRAVDASSNTSASSNTRLAAAVFITDPSLVSGVTIVKAQHVTDLRQSVNAARVLANLSPATWTDASLTGQLIKAVHVTELRTKLNEALQALSLTPPSYTDAALTGVVIKRVHINELRSGANSSGAGDTGGSSPVPRDGLASVSYDSATNRINTSGWEYDAAGNQTRVQRADGSWQRYVYDAAGRMVKVQNDSSVTQLIHTYGASNHRLIEQVGDESSNQRTYYAWAGNSVTAEYEETPSAPTTPRWVKSNIYLGSRLLATITPNGAGERVEYHHPDRLGTRLVTNNQDTTGVEQVTLPFGTALDGESSGQTKRRFTSYERSTVSGLDYAVNRHYDPLQGRFTQADPIGMAAASLDDPQSLNMYAYCGNDPINHMDPQGLFFGGLFKAIGRFFAKVFGFFSKVAMWVSIVVAVAVAAAFIFPAIAPILGDIFFKLGIWKLGAGVPLSFAGGGSVAAGLTLGPTSFVLGGLTSIGAANSFQSRRRQQQRPRERLGDRIARIAAKNIGEGAWRTSVERQGRDGQKHEANSNKCSTFVFDVIKAAGGPAPTSGGQGAWNATAGEWGNANVKTLGKWEIVTDGSLRPGDVIARPIPGGGAGATGHVAIIGPGLETIGTGVDDGIITSTNWGTGRSTDGVVVRRCKVQ